MVTRAERSNSFGAVAEDYDRLRPPPADAAVDWLVSPGCRVAVDLAAGTGLLTRALTTRVPEVIAVEPDDRMRAVLSARSPQVQALSGYGESIPLDDGCADAVFVASAWHWMDESRAVPEIARVLRPGGRFGVVGTTRDRTADSEWMAELDQFRTRLDKPAGSGQPTAPRMGQRVVNLPDGGSFRDIATESFGFVVPMAVDDVIALLGTYSVVITATERERRAGLERLRALVGTHAPGQDTLDVAFRSWCWRADRV
jgi:ubiquinone/menaquinone biosynthesis C-methylase UbiE